MFYEVIYETGEVSVADYPDDVAALGALKEQNDRAKQGYAAGPQGGAASRISKVLKYNDHPGSLNEDGCLSAEVLTASLPDLIKQYTDKNGVVNVLAFGEGVSSLVYPMVTPDTPHGSRFKMAEDSELDLSSFED